MKRLPRSGTASLVVGIVSLTMFENTVNESKMVTPEMIICKKTIAQMGK